MLWQFVDEDRREGGKRLVSRGDTGFYNSREDEKLILPDARTAGA